MVACLTEQKPLEVTTMKFSECPRCNFESYERLGNHSYCVNCNYSPTYDYEAERVIPEWVHDFLNSNQILLPVGAA